MNSLMSIGHHDFISSHTKIAFRDILDLIHKSSIDFCSYNLMLSFQFLKKYRHIKEVEPAINNLSGIALKWLLVHSTES